MFYSSFDARGLLGFFENIHSPRYIKKSRLTAKDSRREF